ncbi:MAG: isoprenylcysteine carboxylmethyltransferase family protein [Deltaproteobacteria bacterium]|nr:isoprenylcysteine carboxylmethyltransferase family protein [Deltaproteobacteria bacterium]
MSFSFVLPYALLALLGLVELPALGRKRPESERRDAGSFWVFNLVVGGAFFVAFFVANTTRIGAMDEPLATLARALAIVLGVAGAAVRTWAISTLGRYFTRTVQVSSDQPVIENGPYKLIRHPSYTGLGFLFISIALALTNWISLALCVVSSVIAAVYRIRVEEAALVQAIGAPYAEYMRRTKRLIPYIF